MKTSAFSFFAVLALAFLLVDGAAGKFWKKKGTKDCCPSGKFCCGSSCIKNSLKPVVKCAGPPACCPKAPPPPPPKDCCPANTFCCGSSCEPDEVKPRILCPTLPDCSKECENPTVSDPCAEKPLVVGDCKAAIPRWSFIEKTGKCEQFSYGGCGGTKNNFESEKACKKTCKVVDEPAEDCCPKGQFCCGGGCLPLSDAPFTTCLAGGTCCGSVDPVPIDPGCICPAVFQPVCSEGTGKEYGNACEASCAKDPGPFLDGPCKQTH